MAVLKDTQMLGALVAATGIVAHYRLAERSEKASRRMEALAGLAEGINEKNYLERILQTIAEMVADKLDSPVCSVMLVDQERQELNIRSTASANVNTV